jgi:hypothetical protein
MAFPTLPDPIYPIKERTYYPAYKSQMDAPYRVIRRKWTLSKKIWTVEWTEENALTETNYQTLLTYFLAQQGSAFTWTHPDTSASYTVTFDQDELIGDIPYHGYRTTKVDLRQQ